MQQRDKFLKTWKINYVLAYFIGFGLLHPVIAHGFTGEHDVALTLPQFIMHTVSLLVFAIMITIVRNKTFATMGTIHPLAGLAPALVFIPGLFWLGYYTLYVPFDILFSFSFTGFLNGWYLSSFMSEKKKWVWQSTLAGFCGALAGIVCGIGCYFLFIKDMKGLAGDFTIWILISVPAAAVYAWMSARFLKKQMPFI